MKIGRPQRTFTIEPVESPVPKLEPPPKAPVAPVAVPAPKERVPS
jgi:hypothetical protein